jgi:hypothetical protein
LSVTAFSPRRHRCLAVGRNEASHGLDQIGEGRLRVGRNDEVDHPEVCSMGNEATCAKSKQHR